MRLPAACIAMHRLRTNTIGTRARALRALKTSLFFTQFDTLFEASGTCMLRCCVCLFACLCECPWRTDVLCRYAPCIRHAVQLLNLEQISRPRRRAGTRGAETKYVHGRSMCRHPSPTPRKSHQPHSCSEASRTALITPLRPLPHMPTNEQHRQPYFFPNLASPIFSPLSTTFSTLSMAPSTFWSGAAVPLSKSATIVGVVLHFVARSFCVMVVPLSFFAFARAALMASPTRVPTVLGLTMSSLRSTFVRCWPSTAPERAAWCAVSVGAVGKVVGGRRAYGIASGELLLRRDNGAGALGGVERRAAADDRLALRGAGAARAAADLGYRVPVVGHAVCLLVVVVVVVCGFGGCVGDVWRGPRWWWCFGG